MQEGYDEPPSLWQENKANQGTDWKALRCLRREKGKLWRALPFCQVQPVLCCLQPSSTVTFAELQIFFPQILGGKGLWGVGKGLWCFKSISYLFALF